MAWKVTEGLASNWSCITKLQWFIHLRALGIMKGDEHPAYTPHEVRHTLSFYVYLAFTHAITLSIHKKAIV